MSINNEQLDNEACFFFFFENHPRLQRAQIVYEQIVNEAQPSIEYRPTTLLHTCIIQILVGYKPTIVQNIIC